MRRMRAIGATQHQLTIVRFANRVDAAVGPKWPVSSAVVRCESAA